jgi:hypothetical protein
VQLGHAPIVLDLRAAGIERVSLDQPLEMVSKFSRRDDALPIAQLATHVQSAWKRPKVQAHSAGVITRDRFDTGEVFFAIFEEPEGPVELPTLQGR